MKIALLGIHKEWASSNLMATALERLGHEVDYIHYRRAEEIFALEPGYDMAITCKGSPLMSREGYRHVHKVAQHKVLFWMDTFNNWRAESTFAVKDLGWSWTCTGSIVKQRIEQATGSQKGLRLPQGHLASTEWGCSETAPDNQLYNAPLFFGSVNGRRKKTLDALQKAGICVHRPKRYLYGAELQAEVLRHPVVLGLNSTDDVISVRAQTVLAMGGALLQEMLPDFRLDFAHGPPHPTLKSPAMGFRGINELVTKIQVILDEDKIARGAGTPFAEWIRERFNWHYVMERVVKHGAQHG